MGSWGGALSLEREQEVEKLAPWEEARAAGGGHLKPRLGLEIVSFRFVNMLPSSEREGKATAFPALWV